MRDPKTKTFKKGWLKTKRKCVIYEIQMSEFYGFILLQPTKILLLPSIAILNFSLFAIAKVVARNPFASIFRLVL